MERSLQAGSGLHGGLPGGDLQTLWPYFFRRKTHIDLIRERLELPDGDFVDLSLTANAGAPVVAIFPRA